MRETITLNTQEQERMMVLNRLLVGQLTAVEAAVLLNLSERQVRRLLAAYQKEGAAALVHGNRGRKPVQSISEQVRRQVIELASTKYAGCNYQHLRDLLAEREGIELSRASVRRIVLAAGMRSPRTQRRRQHRRRRVRYAQEGMLVQIDGSRHAWLEERGPWLCLIAAIDDATGKLAAAVFRQQEDAAGYFLLVQQMLEQHGRPLALYHDRHGIFKQTSKATETDTLEEQLAGKQNPTQFGRLLEELEITSIAARSPQAKGRVERLFGTLQDRLVVELRLADARTIEQAQQVVTEYLPRFNAQFAVAATQPGSAYRPLSEHSQAEMLFCFKYWRTVGADNVVSFAKQRLQIGADTQRRSYAHARVQVHERLDGSLAVYHAGRCLSTTPAPAEAPLVRARTGPRVTSTPADAVRTASAGSSPAAPATPKPRADHPWRKPVIASKRTKSLDT
jgi:transposase